jgi:hypothetical protein
MEVDMLWDPERFADAIRSVALDAHRTLAETPSPATLHELSRRISRLSCALGDARSGPLGVWLESLGRVVRATTKRRVPASTTSCRRRELCRMSS